MIRRGRRQAKPGRLISGFTTGLRTTCAKRIQACVAPCQPGRFESVRSHTRAILPIAAIERRRRRFSPPRRSWGRSGPESAVATDFAFFVPLDHQQLLVPLADRDHELASLGQLVDERLGDVAGGAWRR